MSKLLKLTAVAGFFAGVALSISAGDKEAKEEAIEKKAAAYEPADPTVDIPKVRTIEGKDTRNQSPADPKVSEPKVRTIEGKDTKNQSPADPKVGFPKVRTIEGKDTKNQEPKDPKMSEPKVRTIESNDLGGKTE